MIGQLVFRGMVIGLIAGLLAFGWAKAFGEPAVDVAIAFESARDHEMAAAAIAAGRQPEPDGPDIFSRTVQAGAGLLTGMVVVGAGLGGVFAIMFAFANGRVGGLGPQATSALIALLGLITLYVVPSLKYPANPPSVGEPETIKLRTGLYFVMMAASVASTAIALLARSGLARRYGTWNGSVLAAGVYLVSVTVVLVALPSINEVPPAFPAVTLWNFRLASLGIQTVLWMSVGLMFGYAAAATTRNL